MSLPSDEAAPLPFPGLVQRRLVRADHESLHHALYATACDLARFPRAADIFAREFPSQPSNSRLNHASMLLFAFGALTPAQLTPAQLTNALDATRAGAATLLR